ARTNRIFTVGFLQSMSLALVLITVLIALIFRSFRLAVISLVPNVLPIVLPISFYGLIGKPLDGPAVFVSSVALGVCVDDTIHFFTKFSRARSQGKSMVDALQSVFENVGSALTITSVVLMVGFGFLALSDFAPNSKMGSLAVVMIGLAWVADFCMVPALLSFLPDGATSKSPSKPSA
ncbi:MAG: putative RND superfamily exporter protein, partial [Pseudohongiellaceae bacterium]